MASTHALLELTYSLSFYYDLGSIVYFKRKYLVFIFPSRFNALELATKTEIKIIYVSWQSTTTKCSFQGPEWCRAEGAAPPIPPASQVGEVPGQIRLLAEGLGKQQTTVQIQLRPTLEKTRRLLSQCWQ